MFVDVDAALGKVEFSAADLLLSFLIRVQREFLGHLQDNGLTFVLVAYMMIVIEGKILLLLVGDVRVEGDTAINKLILTTLIALKSLAPNLFLTIDKAILVTMMIEVDLADTSINLNNFLPVVR